ncbi:hypothetical protein IKR20_06625 [bacterium]|nr:hypothetical protein [bacterium]
MSKDNKTKFGNMKLGMINKMLVSFIGKEAFLDYCKKYHEDGELDWQSEEAFRRHLPRLFKEQESSYRDLNPNYEQSVYRIAYKILDDFCKQYGLSDHIYDILLYFGEYLTSRLSETAYPVCETYCLLLQEFLIIARVLVREAVDSLGKDSDIFNALRFSFLNAKKKYHIVFDKFWKKLKKQKDYNNLNLPNSDTLKNIIRNFRQGKNNVTWKNMKVLLDFFKNTPDFSSKSSLLIEAYLTANIESFIETEIPEAKDALQNIEHCLEEIGDLFDKSTTEEEILQNQDFLRYVESLEDMEANLFNGLEDKSGPIDSALSEILEDHIYLQDEKKAEDLITNVKEIAPEASDFYCNWLRAYIAVAKGEFKNAKKLYNEAFKNIHFAGMCAKDFLTQASVLSVFCDSNPDTVRGSIDPEKDSKTPFPKDAKRFAEYGYAIGVFDAPAEEAYLEYLHREDYFNEIFPPEMRFSKIKISSRGMQPNVFICGDIKEMVEKEYIQLSKLNKKDINKQLLMLDAKGGQRRPPLSEAIVMFSYHSDTRFLDLVEKWLGFVDPKTEIKELNFNTVSDFGETPFNAATMVYEEFCLKNNDPDAPEKKRLKKITTHILDKTNKEYLGIITKRRSAHPLHNLIDSGDTELVRKTLEKFVEYGLDIDNEKNPNRYRNRDGKWENLKSPNTFLHRCIEHEAWNILEMFLTDFKDAASETIKKYNDSGQYAPFVFFFEKNKEKRTGFMEKFIKLFESCGAVLTINLADELKKQP